LKITRGQQSCRRLGNPGGRTTKGTSRRDKHEPAPVGWTKTFTDPRLCAAIVDRLTSGGNIIETGTDSYRLAHTKSQQAAAS
jgi:hypothetical protein